MFGVGDNYLSAEPLRLLLVHVESSSLPLPLPPFFKSPFPGLFWLLLRRIYGLATIVPPAPSTGLPLSAQAWSRWGNSVSGAVRGANPLALSPHETVPK